MTATSQSSFEPSPAPRPGIESQDAAHANAPQKIVMTLLVRDEEDILEANLEFHRAQGVDFFILMDNLSVDGTPAIIRRYVEMGLAHGIVQEDDDYAQGEWVTSMARMACTTFGADWVINNDADEFWWPGQGTLKETLGALAPQFNAILAPRSNFVPLDEEDSETPFHQRMVYREAKSLNALGQPLPPKMAHRGSPDVVVAQGNHSVSGLQPLEVAQGQVEILHYPIRNYRQLLNKITKGGAAYERNNKLPPGTGGTWRTLYREFLATHGLVDFYQKHLYSRERITQELATGAIVRDDRLKRHFAP
jgi:hypothetical protein